MSGIKFFLPGANRIKFFRRKNFFTQKTAKRFFFGMEAAAYKLSMTETPKKPKE